MMNYTIFLIQKLYLKRNLKKRLSADSLTSKEVVDLLNELHEENEELKKENEQLQKYVYHCPQTCRIILAYLNKCGSENVEAVNNAMDIDEYFDEEIDTLK